MNRSTTSDFAGVPATRSDRPRPALSVLIRVCKHVVRDPVAWVLLSPAAWVALFWGLVLVATVVNGGWPHRSQGWPGSPEWNDVSIDVDRFVWVAGPLYLGLVALLVTVPLGAAQSLIGVFRPKLRRARGMYIAFFVCSLLVYVTVWRDPFGAMSWFLD